MQTQTMKDMKIMNASSIQIDTVFNNIAPIQNSCCSTLWGFSAYIQTPNHNILFDTGSNGRILLKNMQAKGIDLQNIDTVFLSHGHWDHIGGVDSVIELNPHLKLFVTPHLSKNFIRDYRQQSQGVEVIDEKLTEIAPGIYSSGAKGSSMEQSMILECDEGLILIFGCAHSGVGEVAQLASKAFQKEILLLLGGFHLENRSDTEIRNLMQIFQQIHTKTIIPSHCTGEHAMKLFEEEFQGRYIQGGVGQSITFDNAGSVVLL